MIESNNIQIGDDHNIVHACVRNDQMRSKSALPVHLSRQEQILHGVESLGPVNSGQSFVADLREKKSRLVKRACTSFVKYSKEPLPF